MDPAPQESVAARLDPPLRDPSRRRWRTGVALGGLLLLAASVPALQWQQSESSRVRCQTNMRRLSSALLLYAQDHDGRFPPPQYETERGKWREWMGILEPYYSSDSIATCPANPADRAVQPILGFPYPYSYALNERFYGVFSPGPFPIENLELPAQTVMLAESGGFRGPRPGGGPVGTWAMNVYTDTAKWPRAFPSPHNNRMNVAAADGHVVSLKIAHTTPDGHDSLYGRLGGTIYNWNAGHPNGDTAGPPRD